MTSNKKQSFAGKRGGGAGGPELRSSPVLGKIPGQVTQLNRGIRCRVLNPAASDKAQVSVDLTQVFKPASGSAPTQQIYPSIDQEKETVASSRCCNNFARLRVHPCEDLVSGASVSEAKVSEHRQPQRTCCDFEPNTQKT